MENVKAEVVRPFYLGGIVQKEGKFIELGKALYIELHSMNKVKPAAEPQNKPAMLKKTEKENSDAK